MLKLLRCSHFQILSVSGAALMDHLQFRSIVKDACFVAGLQGKPVVLYIAENLCKDGLQDVAALLTDGKGFSIQIFNLPLMHPALQICT